MNAELELCGERIVLRPDRSLVWPRAQTLIVADPHFGKSEAFRAAGLPVPGGTEGALARLDVALAETDTERLVVLGDFWHARDGRTERVVSELAAWRAGRASLCVDLVRGNHDRAGPPPDGWGDWANGLIHRPFVFQHFPEPSDEGYVLAGHLHPSILLAGRGHQRLRLSCFWFGQRVGVLPAFGDFTGAATVRILEGDRVFAVAGDAVVEVPRA